MRELAVEEWGKRLAGLTGEQIKHGLDAWDDKWPPNAETFRKACLGMGEDWQHRTAAYRPFPRALPKPKANAEKAAAEIEKMRRCLKRA